MKGNLRGGVLRIVQFVLGLDGIFHVGIVVSAIEEGATRTAILTGFQACVFFAGVYFIGHDHSHHKEHDHHHGEE
jgi:hypothetical protein